MFYQVGRLLQLRPGPEIVDGRNLALLLDELLQRRLDQVAPLARVLALARRQDGDVDLAGQRVRGGLLEGLPVKAGSLLDIDLLRNEFNQHFYKALASYLQM
jgi:hypothetical protein